MDLPAPNILCHTLAIISVAQHGLADVSFHLMRTKPGLGIAKTPSTDFLHENPTQLLQVSWIRKGRHPVVLSSGGFTFTSDKRVRVTHGPEGGDPDDWRLAIDPVMERDSGLYECQVNTRPHKMSLVFKINVMRE